MIPPVVRILCGDLGGGVILNLRTLTDRECPLRAKKHAGGFEATLLF